MRPTVNRDATESDRSNRNRELKDLFRARHRQANNRYCSGGDHPREHCRGCGYRVAGRLLRHGFRCRHTRPDTNRGSGHSTRTDGNRGLKDLRSIANVSPATITAPVGNIRRGCRRSIRPQSWTPRPPSPQSLPRRTVEDRRRNGRDLEDGVLSGAAFHTPDDLETQLPAWAGEDWSMPTYTLLGSNPFAVDSIATA